MVQRGEHPKDYWRQYSSIKQGNRELFINSGSENWALFENDKYQYENYDEVNKICYDLPTDFKAAYEEFMNPNSGVESDFYEENTDF